eukprot:TRINITY_DN12830_c0_g1_i1.p1 TRINITY_DN12830_c0_g1~~TRINITY_DN12830_c0_g1_i1.p1  ORF type:complete len:146 (+),score=25.13 TRINITY_DN12830_c0_g1_i1:58-438(+)
MAECFSGIANVVGFSSKQRRQLANRGDACAESGFEQLEMCGDGAAADVADSLGSCSTHAPTPATRCSRKRDIIRRWIFGDRTPASESSYASTAPGIRKRDWIRQKLVMKKTADVLEQDALLEEGNM